MKFEEANDEAREVERECLEVVKKQNERWMIPDADLGELKEEDGIGKYFAGMTAFSYLRFLIEDGVVDDGGIGDVSDLEAVPGFKDGSFKLPE